MASQEIIAYLASAIARGSSIEQAKAAALAKGWNAEDVNGAYAVYAIREGSFAPKQDMLIQTYAIPPAHRIALVPIIVILGSLSTIAYGYYKNVVVSTFPVDQSVDATTTLTGSRNQLFVPAYVPAPITTSFKASFPHATIVQSSPDGEGTINTVPQTPTPIRSVGAVTTLTPSPASVTTVSAPVVAVTLPASPAPEESVSAPPVPNPVPTPDPTVDPDPEPTPVNIIDLPPAPPIPTPLPPPVPIPEVPPEATTSTSTGSTTAILPPPVPPVPPVPVVFTGGSYATYPGCQAPDSRYTRTVFIDPVTGSETLGDGSSAHPYHTLTEAFADKKILPGDKVELLPGDHGKVFSDSARNTILASTASWIWIDFMPGATVQSFDLRHMSHVLITRAGILRSQGSTGGTLFSASNGDDIILADSALHGTFDSSGWAVSDWLAAPNGVSVVDTPCSSLLRNSITNTRFAMSVSTAKKDTESSRMKSLIQENVIRNFSGDGIRPNASDMLVRSNQLYDEYVSPQQGDGNHDDAMQLFALGGVVYDNVDIENNWIQESTDPNRAFNAPLQGIDIFDGTVTNVVVKNNVILVSSYWGIGMFGVHDSVIENNTVVNSTTNGRHIKIAVTNNKDGSPPVNTIVKNNVDPNGAITGIAGAVSLTNNYSANVDPTTLFTTFNRATQSFDVHVKLGSVLDGKGQGAFPIGAVSINVSAPAIGHLRLLASVGAAFSSFWETLIRLIRSVL